MRRFNLNTGLWRRARRSALERDGYRCRTCGRGGRLEVDHILPRHLGGPLYDLANLQSLCYQCHLTKSQTEARRIPARPGYKEKWAELISMLE